MAQKKFLIDYSYNDSCCNSCARCLEVKVINNHDRGDEKWWIFTEPGSSEVNIHFFYRL